jgi:membrane protein DedA with SNARE-associated domain
VAEWIIQAVTAMGATGVFLLTLLETVFPPIPSELIMPLAGYLVAQDRMTLAGVIVAGTLGSTAGALLLYWAGAALGEQRLKAFADDHGRWLTLSRADIDRAGDWFDRHGGWAVFLCRLVPGLRSLISIPAGIHRMPLPAFLLYTTAGSAAWTALLVYAGYALGRNFEQVGRYLEPVTLVVVGAMALWYAWRFARHKGAPSASG